MLSESISATRDGGTTSDDYLVNEKDVNGESVCWDEVGREWAASREEQAPVPTGITSHQ
jgi:hypothetical protein